MFITAAEPVTTSDPEVTPEMIIIQAIHTLEAQFVQSRQYYDELRSRLSQREFEAKFDEDQFKVNEKAIEYGKALTQALELMHKSFEGDAHEPHVVERYKDHTRRLFELWQGRDYRYPHSLSFLKLPHISLEVQFSGFEGRSLLSTEPQVTIPNPRIVLVLSDGLARFMTGQYTSSGLLIPQRSVEPIEETPMVVPAGTPQIIPEEPEEEEAPSTNHYRVPGTGYWLVRTQAGLRHVIKKENDGRLKGYTIEGCEGIKYPCVVSIYHRGWTIEVDWTSVNDKIKHLEKVVEFLKEQ